MREIKFQLSFNIYFSLEFTIKIYLTYWSKETAMKMCELLRKKCEDTSVIRDWRWCMKIREEHNNHTAWEKRGLGWPSSRGYDYDVVGPLMMIDDSINRKFNEGSSREQDKGVIITESSEKNATKVTPQNLRKKISNKRRWQ